MLDFLLLLARVLCSNSSKIPYSNSGELSGLWYQIIYRLHNICITIKVRCKYEHIILPLVNLVTNLFFWFGNKICYSDRYFVASFVFPFRIPLNVCQTRNEKYLLLICPISYVNLFMFSLSLSLSHFL